MSQREMSSNLFFSKPVVFKSPVRISNDPVVMRDG